jgi:riboflavin synthase
VFTGIVEEVGKVITLAAGKLTVSAREVLQGTKIGDSINVSGACLTVTAMNGSSFTVDVMPETLRRTNIGTLVPGMKVNLERAMAANGRFGGHFVQGHVDGTGSILSMTQEQEAVIMKVTTPADITRYLVEKAYIAVDGISLTITHCDSTSFTVSLVAHTLKTTSLWDKKAGDIVNLEVDIMAKYMEKMRIEGKPDITREFLAEHGFLAS